MVPLSWTFHGKDHPKWSILSACARNQGLRDRSTRGKKRRAFFQSVALNVPNLLKRQVSLSEIRFHFPLLNTIALTRKRRYSGRLVRPKGWIFFAILLPSKPSSSHYIAKHSLSLFNSCLCMQFNQPCLKKSAISRTRNPLHSQFHFKIAYIWVTKYSYKN